MKTLDRSRLAAPGTRLPRKAGFRAAAAIAAGSLLLASAGVAHADDISNDLDVSADAVAEIMPLTLGGPQGTTLLYVVKDRTDGTNGCSITGNKEAVSLSLTSSNTGVATVSPGFAIFDSCGDTQQVTVTAVGEGTATVSASLTSNNTGEVFDVTPVNFTVNVTLPVSSNTAPTVSISGVSGGASYIKGSVPAAVCDVTDKEDSPESFLATLSAITGAAAADGIGNQTATCSYKDEGGLTATSSVTYSIYDATAPVIDYTLNPIAPDGDNGWYQKAVALTWLVTEGDSPSTLIRNGCVDQLITADQLAQDYSCSASSSGGTSATTTLTLKKDGTAPTVEYTSASGTVGNEGWYTSEVKALFTGTDTMSGLATNTQTVSSSGEGTAVKVYSPAFTDLAGNTTEAGAVSQSFNIDWTAPDVTYVGASPTTPNGNGWYNTDVVATFAGIDLISGLASPATLTATSTGEGTDVVVESPVFEDVAGNVSVVGAATSDSFKIDKTLPTAEFDSIMADVYYGSTQVFPNCKALDILSGPDGCVVTGGGTAVGTHTLTATAKDKAGNTATATQTYQVKPWTIKGFYQPIDMGNVLNTVKGGSTVPAKFEVFAGDKELTDPSLMKFSMAPITCSLGYLLDDVETTSTGSTSLRYDATAGQFIYNWKTPTAAGSCYKLTMTAADGTSSISANFKLK